MLTPQEVQDKKFSKAVFGGYDMAEVDDFLDQLGDDYDKLVKESAVLKSKLKTLAEKVEEYRAVDEEMRKTLVVAKRSSEEQIAEARSESAAMIAEAQRERDEMIAAARKKSDEMVAVSRAQAESRLAEIKKDIITEEERLERARSSMQSYVAASADACRRQIEILNTITTAPVKRTAVQTDIPEPTVSNAMPAAEVETEKAVAAFASSVIENERITGRHTAPVEGETRAETEGMPLNASPETRRVDIGGVMVNVTTLDLNENEADGEDVFHDIFSNDLK